MLEKFEELQHEARLIGVEIRPYFGYRDEAEQTALYAQGRDPLEVTNALRDAAGLAPITDTQNRKIVTKARYGESAHTVDPSKAVDYYVVHPATGEAQWWEGVDLDADGESDYHEVGVLAERIGLTWGGRFAMRDLGHVELP
jgi:peptidoglycan L-alanyl-D-glutamate endopeptidase CwlK